MTEEVFYMHKGITGIIVLKVFESNIFMKSEGVDFTKWLVKYAIAFYIIWCSTGHQRKNDCLENIQRISQLP
jgi:hypothetical protein